MFFIRRILFLAAAIIWASTSAHVHARGPLDFLPKSYFSSPRAEQRAGALSLEDALALYTPAQRKPGFAACADQFPGNEPINTSLVSSDMKPIALCSSGFAVLYSAKSRTPLVVVERLNAARLTDAKGQKRSNQFYPDPRLPREARAELGDFAGHSVDRGHQSPAADQRDGVSMQQSFALSNMVAQDPTCNRKPWNKIEQDVRKYVMRAGGNVFVYTGPLFSDGFQTIGANRVWMPTHLYKLVYDETSHRAWAYIQPNAPVERVEPPIDYVSFVKVTGLALLGNRPVAGATR